MLDGAARVKEVVAAAARDGQPAVGITDHGNMYGVLDFYKACKGVGVNPVIGMEAYMALNSRTERPTRRGRMDDTGGDAGSGEKLYYHLTLLAENNDGYANLIKLSSRAFLEGYYYKPRLDWELLEEHSKGLIATSGCLGGIVLQHLQHGEQDKALAAAARLQDIFGINNFFVELQDHGLRQQRETNPMLLEIARKIRAPLVATNDSHYTTREHAEAHDVLLCVQTGSTVDDPNRFKFDGDEHYLKSSAEMRHLFGEVEVACDNTLWIAERAHVEIEFGKPQLPDFPLPEGFDNEDEYLRQLCFAGARERYGSELPSEVVERLEFELNTISSMGFSNYFLIVWDLISHARARHIRVGPGRGSAAGCCVAYCLKIVDLDPIKYDLLFERFLNPGRIEMPDIDMDFDDRYRAEMIRYVSEKYGSDHVAQIITFSTIKARAAVRDAARALGQPYSVGDQIAKLMPPLVMGRDTPLWACLNQTDEYADGYRAAEELRKLYEADDVARRVIDAAAGLEGLRRQDSIHAAAVVIAKKPLTEYMPIQRKPEPGRPVEEAPIVTQFEMNNVSALGLLKMDFLGLRNLTTIERCLDLIEMTTGQRFDIDKVPLDDPKTFDLLRRGDAMGVFQLESPAMRSLMRQLAPTSFEDIAALVALYRPGPMSQNMHTDYADIKNGRKPRVLFHPDAEEILADTHGLMIYQESVMRVAQKFAGFSLEQADNLRKACGKKIREKMAEQRALFVSGCVDNGYSEKVANDIFNIIEPFADYAFNKSHSFGYGFVAYQTAFLKANFPVEYMSALLTSVKNDKTRTAVYLAECRLMGIDVDVPSVNKSFVDFAPSGAKILFGLSAVRNVGVGLVERILAERENGEFGDFIDFCARVDYEVLNKRALESLIKAGAFDSLHVSRQGLLQVSDVCVDAIVARRREHDAGVMSLFGGSDAQLDLSDLPVPAEREWPKKVRLGFEKEMLGTYLSDHPLAGFEQQLGRSVDSSIGEVLDVEDHSVLKIGGVISSVQRRQSRRGDMFATVTLEDLSGSVDVWFFARAYRDVEHLLKEDSIVMIRGRVDRRDEQPKFVGQSAELLEIVPDGEFPPLRIRLSIRRGGPDVLERFKRLLARHPGHSEVILELDDVLARVAGYQVSNSESFLAELRAQFGHDVIGSKKSVSTSA